MANILTAAEAATVLRTDEFDDANMRDLLPQVDAYILNATGRDWTVDATINAVAKAAARMLLVQWHEDPGMSGNQAASLTFGLMACLVQLQALALQLESSGVPEEDLALVKSQPADGATGMAVGSNLVLVFNHSMSAGATTAVTLAAAGGGAFTTVNSLDGTLKILTVNPTGSLVAATRYVITLTAAADIYGQTLTDTIAFTTA
jgi:methionine-rich copper-binding protein CopC